MKFPLWILLHSPFSSLLGPNILLRILFSNTLITYIYTAINASDSSLLNRNKKNKADNNYQMVRNICYALQGGLRTILSTLIQMKVIPTHDSGIINAFEEIQVMKATNFDTFNIIQNHSSPLFRVAYYNQFKTRQQVTNMDSC